MPPGMPPGIPPTQSVNLMVIDRVGMGLIPACSWRHAQQPPENRIEIRPAVVEESAIEENSASWVSLQKTVTSWVFMGQGHTLYHCVAGVEPNNLPQTELESVKRL